MTPFRENRLGGESGQLMPTVRLNKWPTLNTFATKTLQRLLQVLLVADTTNDKVGMVKIGSDQRGSFNGCMASLNDLLRERQITADKDVDVILAANGSVNLVSHGTPI